MTLLLPMNVEKQYETTHHVEDLSFYKEALHGIPYPIFIKDESLHFVFFNKAYEEFFGVNTSSLLGKSVLDLEYLSMEERELFQAADYELVQKNTTSFEEKTFSTHVAEEVTALYWRCGFQTKDGTKGLIGSIVDISKQKDIQATLKEKLRLLAKSHRMEQQKGLTDDLTQLPNRRCFRLSINAMYENAQQNGTTFTLLLLDLDDFKQINDTYGHHIGDLVLQDFSTILRNTCRRGDIAARIGGEEFAMLLPDTDSKKASAVARRILMIARQPSSFPHGYQVTCSIGVYEYRSGDNDVSMLERADKALYHVKQNGKNSYHLFKK